MRIRDCRLQRRFPFDIVMFHSGDIRDQVAKLSEIPPNFLAVGKTDSDCLVFPQTSVVSLL